MSDRGEDGLTDFCLISHFSELTGPELIQLIPESGVGNFDIERFVLKIMSVDHQAKSGDSGVFGEDTQVFFREHSENVWCYVHHLTLLDINARGYVRPICLTYATRDSHKIMRNFRLILKNFTDVSNILKTGNYELFRDDLKKRMADLAYTRQVVDTVDGASMVTAATPGIISRHFDDMRLMRERMTKDAVRLEGKVSMRPDAYDATMDLASLSQPKRALKMASDEFGFVVVPRSGDGVGDGAQSDDDVGVDSDGERMVFQQPLSEQPWGFGGGQGVDDGTPKAGADKNKAAIDVDDDELEEGEVVDHLGEVMVNIVRALGIEQDYKPRVIQSLHRTRTMSSSLRPISELCGAHYAQAMDKLDRIRWHLSASTLALAIEQNDAMLMSSACSALVVGGVPVMNFNWRAQAESSASVSAASPSSGTEEEYDFRSFAAVSGSDFDMANELADQTMAYAHGVVLASRPFGSRPSSVNPYSIGRHLLVVDSYAQSAELPPAEEPIQYDDLRPMQASNYVSKAMADASMPLVGLAAVLWPRAATMESSRVGGDGAATLVSPDGTPIKKKSAATLDDSAMAGADEGEDTAGPDTSRDRSPAASLLLLRRFSFSKHALYSVLRGRTLVVYSQYQEDAQPLVEAYACVAVARWGRRVVNPWLDRAPRMSDLSQYTVLGLSKQHKIPSSVARYVSVLDADHMTLDAPPYTGRLLENVCDASRRWQTAETFAAFLYAELHEASIVASLFYYLCCVGTPVDPTGDRELLHDGRLTPAAQTTQFKKTLATSAAPLVEQSPVAFFREHRLSPCDALIVQHWSEVIKEQQSQELYGPVGTVSPVIRLDYARCERFTDNTGGSLMGSLSSFIGGGSGSSFVGAAESPPLSSPVSLSKQNGRKPLAAPTSVSSARKKALFK